MSNENQTYLWHKGVIDNLKKDNRRLTEELWATQDKLFDVLKTLDKKQITKQQYRVLLDLFMVTDPWPLPLESASIMEDYLNKLAPDFGHPNWVEAYHNVEK